MKMRFLLLLLSVLLMFSVGCRKAAIRPEGGVPATIVHENFTAKDMREAILKGCTNASWRATDIDTNTLEATYIERGGNRIAVVSIHYTATSYTINYKSSVNLKYKAKNDGTFALHYKYNTWIENLDQSIRNNLAKKMT